MKEKYKKKLKSLPILNFQHTQLMCVDFFKSYTDNQKLLLRFFNYITKKV